MSRSRRSVMIRPAVTPITGMRFSRAGMRKSSAATGARFTLSSPTGASGFRASKSESSTDAPAGDHLLDAAFVEIAQEHDVGAPARRDEAAVAQAEGVRRRTARRAVDGMARPAERDQRADHEIEVALLADVERIAVVGAERHERGGVFVQHLGERMQGPSTPSPRGSGSSSPWRAFRALRRRSSPRGRCGCGPRDRR